MWGLRISDLLNLRWVDILNVDNIDIIEKKTQKRRTIKINAQLKKHISICCQEIKPKSINDFLFTSQQNSVYSIQRINVIFKRIKVKYNLQINHFSSHSMRKTFGREVFNQSGDKAELALIKLAELFNHSNTHVTRRYLGISKDEWMNTYDLLYF